MVRKYVILAIILAGLFSGCIGEESIVGKYVLEEDHKAYFILYEDGTFNAVVCRWDIRKWNISFSEQ